MDPSEFTQLAQEVAEAGGDQGVVTAALSKMTDAFSAMFATSKELIDKNEKLNDDKNKLQQYNMELFLQHGQHVRETSGGEAAKEKSRSETIKVEDLFKE